MLNYIIIQTTNAKLHHNKNFYLYYFMHKPYIIQNYFHYHYIIVSDNGAQFTHYAPEQMPTETRTRARARAERKR